jgi:lysophospholipase L1-like esterase
MLNNRIKLFVIIAIIAISSFSCNNGTKYYWHSDSIVSITGRYHPLPDSTAVFAYPGSSIALRIDAQRVTAIISDTSFMDSTAKYRNNTYYLLIDGEIDRKIFLKEGKHEYVLTDGMPKGMHSLELVRLTEALVGNTVFWGFKVEGQRQTGTIIPPRHSIEFIGNSITCGYGLESSTQFETFSPITSNAYLAYAMQAARKINASAWLVAYSGKGAARNWADTVYYNETMPELYSRSLPLDTASKWDFSINTPSAVVISIGANDFSPPFGFNAESFTIRYSMLIDDIAGKYGTDIPIICLNSPVLTAEENTMLQDAINGSIKQKTALNLHYLNLSPVANDDGYGADYHPNEITASRNSDELAELLAKILEVKD